MSNISIIGLHQIIRALKNQPRKGQLLIRQNLTQIIHLLVNFNDSNLQKHLNVQQRLSKKQIFDVFSQFANKYQCNELLKGLSIAKKKHKDLYQQSDNYNQDVSNVKPIISSNTCQNFQSFNNQYLAQQQINKQEEDLQDFVLLDQKGKLVNQSLKCKILYSILKFNKSNKWTQSCLQDMLFLMQSNYKITLQQMKPSPSQIFNNLINNKYLNKYDYRRDVQLMIIDLQKKIGCLRSGRQLKDGILKNLIGIEKTTFIKLQK